MMNFGTPILAAAKNSTDALTMYGSLIWIVLIVVVFYFFLIRPQKKKEKKAQQLRESVQVGDNVTTAGGIMGRVVSLKEDSIVIETGADRSKMQVKKWAIQSVDTIHDDK
jgi:preprotein translocase subunit YajC